MSNRTQAEPERGQKTGLLEKPAGRYILNAAKLKKVTHLIKERHTMMTRAAYETPTEVAAAPPEWEPPMPPVDLVFDDGKPLESPQHRIAMNALIRLALQALSDRKDLFVGGNMFVYYSSAQVRNRDFRGPDFFGVLNVDGERERRGWVVWEENGRYPDVIVELMSPSTANEDLGDKKDIYEGTFKTPDYFVYDPFRPDSLQGWHLNAKQRYEPLVPNERGWLWCETLGLWLGTWQGTIDRVSGFWLRFYDSDGNLIPFPEEAATQRADRLAQRLIELGENPDIL